MNPPASLCAKCFNSLTINFIKCHVCRAKFHFICAQIDDKLIDSFQENKNLVFNCNACLKASSELMSLISKISNELRELKSSIVSNLCEEVKELKQRFNVLAYNLETSSNKQKIIHSNKPYVHANNNNNNANQRSLADIVVNSSNMLDRQSVDDAGSSVTSYPTAVSEMQSNMHETDQQHSGWTNVRRRKRRNRVLVHGENASNDLDVADKKKYLHISSLKPSVSPDMIIDYVEKNTKIAKHHLECTRLVKRDVDVNTLKHVNFKLGVSPCFYDEVMKSTLWPINVRVRPFVFFPRNPAGLPDAS